MAIYSVCEKCWNGKCKATSINIERIAMCCHMPWSVSGHSELNESMTKWANPKTNNIFWADVAINREPIDVFMPRALSDGLFCFLRFPNEGISGSAETLVVWQVSDLANPKLFSNLLRVSLRLCIFVFSLHVSLCVHPGRWQCGILAGSDSAFPSQLDQGSLRFTPFKQTPSATWILD